MARYLTGDQARLMRGLHRGAAAYRRASGSRPTLPGGAMVHAVSAGLGLGRQFIASPPARFRKKGGIRLGVAGAVGESEP
jgi:hypothetical protein